VRAAAVAVRFPFGMRFLFWICTESLWLLHSVAALGDGSNFLNFRVPRSAFFQNLKAFVQCFCDPSAPLPQPPPPPQLPSSSSFAL
jgi:hypothetical protein